MSHGENGYIFGNDEKRVNIDDDIAGVLGECQSLKNKPKVLFFQACRGVRMIQFQFISTSTVFCTLFDTRFYFNITLKYTVFQKK